MIDLFFQQAAFSRRENLISTTWVNLFITPIKCGRKSLDTEYKYCSLGPIWFSLEEDNKQDQTLILFFFLVSFVVEVKRKIKDKKKKRVRFIFFSLVANITQGQLGNKRKSEIWCPLTSLERIPCENSDR